MAVNVCRAGPDAAPLLDHPGGSRFPPTEVGDRTATKVTGTARLTIVIIDTAGPHTART